MGNPYLRIGLHVKYAACRVAYMVPWRVDWPRYLAFGLGVTLSGFGIAVLIAWSVHFVPLFQVAPGQPPLTRHAAICYVLNGAALAFLAMGRRLAASLPAGLVFLLIIVVAFEYFLNRSLGV